MTHSSSLGRLRDRLRRIRALRNTQAAVDQDVPTFVDATARALRSGASLAVSVARASAELDAPLGPLLRSMCARIDAGWSFGSAVDELRLVSTNRSLRVALAAIAIAHESGGAQAAVFDDLAASMRARNAARRELAALTSPVRLSATLIGVLPVVVAVLVALADPRVLSTVGASAFGRVSIAIGVVLDGVGLWWIRKIARFVP